MFKPAELRQSRAASMPCLDRVALRSSHSLSVTAHWVVPGLLAQGDGSSVKAGTSEIDVSSSIRDGSIDLVTLSVLVGAVESQVRADAAVYVHAGSPDDEGEAALVCACTLAKLYELSAEEAFARVRGYCEVRGEDTPGRVFSKGMDEPLDTVRRFIRKARASDCAED